MTDSTETKPPMLGFQLGNAVMTDVASGLLTLLDPAKLHPSVRGFLYVGTGAATGLVGWFGTAPNQDSRPGRTVRAAMAVGLGTLSAAGTKLGFVIDARIHQALLRRGVRNPRPLMAIGSAVITAAMVVVEPPRGHNECQIQEGPEAEALELPRPYG